MKSYEYLVFHSEDIEDVLKAIGNARPVYRRYRFVEIIAEFDGGFVGKYADVIFVMTSKPVEFDAFNVEPVGNVSVHVAEEGELDEFEGLSGYRFGRYSSSMAGDTVELIVEVEREHLQQMLFDYIPSILSDTIIAGVLLKDCYLRASQMAVEENRIMSEIAALSEKVAEADIETLRKLSFEVSSLRTSFFAKFVRLKGQIEKAFESVARAKKVSSQLYGFLSDVIDELTLDIQTLGYYESRFEQTLLGVRDVLDVVHLRLEMLSSVENLELQKRTSSLQAAAAIIEFVAVYYYTLKIWESFLPVKSAPPVLSFSILAAFTTLVVVYTDALGEYLRERRMSKKLVILTVMLLLTVILMVFVPLSSITL